MGKESGKLLRVLFASGGMKTMNHERVLLQGSEIRIDSQDCMCNTVAGQFNANRSVVVEDFDYWKGPLRFSIFPIPLMR